MFAVAIGGNAPRHPVVLRHMVWHLTEVDLAVEEVPEPAVRIVDADGTTTLVVFFSEQTEP